MSRILYASIREGKLFIKESTPNSPSFDDKVIEAYNLHDISSTNTIEFILKRMRMAYEFPDEFVALSRPEQFNPREIQ